jgi:hypothetical protein
VLALDEVLGEALRGDDTALHVASYELRGRIIMDIAPILEPYGCEDARPAQLPAGGLRGGEPRAR